MTESQRTELTEIARRILALVCEDQRETVAPSRVTGQSILDAVTAGMNEADTIVHETKREPVVNCEKCGMRLNPGAVICWCCGAGRQ